ncbi:MAG: EF-hand domain-containing protein [Pseudomonadota bacterium]|nr:hypothetical protein [Gammaproteobacteria bacterium]MEC8012519.1 EF-hand domain-containing protein [Pseudomonadota bacterium]HBF09713.1 hypothetical protein [Gammaproteobacteria bacterium]|tara:strand:- start:4152 stop:4526 length:375 start_codon:yes stop_codon:yes gene_type:complete
MKAKNMMTVAVLALGGLTTTAFAAQDMSGAQSTNGNMGQAGSAQQVQDMNPQTGTMQHQQMQQQRQQQIDNAFTQVDQDKSGSLSEDEFGQINSGKDFKKIDANQDGSVSHQELQDGFAMQSNY